MYATIVKRTLRVPFITSSAGISEAVARQLDVALISVGFKLSKELLEHFSSLHPVAARDAGNNILSAVRELVGDHVRHNTYFIDFPNNVPDTVEFWHECIIDALANPHSAGIVAADLLSGFVNLLNLPRYGKYLHSYEEMLAAHDTLIPAATDRLTLLHLGKTLPEEALAIYHSLAESTIPLNDEDRQLLSELAEFCLSDQQPARISIRENKAIINRVRLAHGASLLVDTVTDVLRLACLLSDGDVTLQEKTRFRSFRKAERRALLAALDQVISNAPGKLGDVNPYRERWKRLGERLHPHDYPYLPHAQDIFAVARAEKRIQPLAAKVEIAFSYDRIHEAITLLATNPGMLFRNVDRIIRNASYDEINELLDSVRTVASRVSGRVILSVHEHLLNRITPSERRIFANRQGKAWVTGDTRRAIDTAVVTRLTELFQEVLLARLPAFPRLVVDPAVLTLALPLSKKNSPEGFRIMPRGSLLPVENSILRFFIYWKERNTRTDYDLSALLLNDDCVMTEHISWTNLRSRDGFHVHSGDITSAPNGASEFIDIDLSKVTARYVVPQVNIYNGENFDAIAECFFGFMSRESLHRGAPYEPTTVRMKSDLCGSGRVSLPLAFHRDDHGRWTAKWMHLLLKGRPHYNRVEENRTNTVLLTRTIMERQYVTLEFLVTLLHRKAGAFDWYDPGKEQMLTEPVAYIGLDMPECLPADSIIYSINNLHDLVTLTG